MINLAGAMSVVSHVETTGRGNTLQTTRYKYHNLSSHLQGLGSLGFDSMEIITPTKVNKTHFSKDWSYRQQGSP